MMPGKWRPQQAPSEQGQKRVSEVGRGEFYLPRALGFVREGKTGPTPLFLPSRLH